MKYPTALLLTTPLLAGGIPADKQLHFVSGGLISMGVGCLADKAGFKHPRLYGIGAAVLAGAAKEMMDRRDPLHHSCEFNDFAATSLGGLTFSYTIRW